MRRLTLVAMLMGFPWVSAAYAHGDLHGQIAAVSAQLSGQPENAELLLQRAELHRLHADFSAAGRDIEQAGSLRPGWEIVDLARGRLATSTGAHEVAAAAMDRFLKTRPEVGDAWLIRARARAALGLHREAVRDFTEAIHRTPSPEPDVYLERARATASLGVDHLNEALAGLEEAKAKVGAAASVELAALDLEIRLARYDAALERVDRLAAPVARKESWRLRKAEILVLAHRETEARKLYDDVLAAIAALPPGPRSTAATAALRQRAEEGRKALVAHDTP